ncbi:DUF4105 domain-containing protein [Allomuricauda sp. d1]|uniref:lipoprotein N-acyltransferase Lnb domain-containing protein n=1 Tax=Allomuricauda sp. d1 TaxID=3136725 RepID=UPI0031D933E6
MTKRPYQTAIVLLIFFCSFMVGQAQLPQLSEDAKISVLTCAAGDELYYAFGHSAFRVQDPKMGIDVVYNYGTFDFNRPNFYLNFAKGKLIYSLSRRRFDIFLYEYELEKRWVKEQILDLDQAEVNQLFQFFEKNYLPKNRDYLYDPLFNNCSTITADVLKNEFGEAITFDGDHLDKRYTFRQLVRQFIPINSWGAFGIDLAWGSVVDRKATVREHMFLPYYAMYQLRNTSKSGKPLVLREREVLDYSEREQNGYFATSPLFWFLLLFLFVGIITYLDYTHKNRNRWLDMALFLLSGLVGVFLLLLWFATDHVSTKYNFDVLWALPLNAIAAFYVFKRALPSWLPKYLWTAFALFGIMILLWIFGVQSFSPLTLILMAMLGLRYVLLIKAAK